VDDADRQSWQKGDIIITVSIIAIIIIIIIIITLTIVIVVTTIIIHRRSGDGERVRPRQLRFNRLSLLCVAIPSSV
jgi:heme/copper-type cytochrome/quinol oxidase subunit 2